jgi:hypothetical protein
VLHDISGAQIEKKRHKHLTNTSCPGMLLGILDLISFRDCVLRQKCDRQDFQEGLRAARRRHADG